MAARPPYIVPKAENLTQAVGDGGLVNHPRSLEMFSSHDFQNRGKPETRRGEPLLNARANSGVTESSDLWLVL